MGLAVAPRRELWMDNVKVAVIAGVLVAHAGSAYLIDLPWYYEERGEPTLAVVVATLPLFVAWLFAMGILFFVAGLLAPRSLARKGPGRFALGRLSRLGVPLLAFFLLLDPVTDWLGSGMRLGLPPWSTYWTPDHDVGPLWFVLALLVASLAYAAWRAARPAPARPKPLAASAPFVAASVILVATFVVRLKYPFADGSPFRINLWSWPQMLTMFTFGVACGERGGFDAIPRAWTRSARWVAALAVFPAAAIFLYALALGDPATITGGWKWGALAAAAGEAVLVVSASLALSALFRDRANRQGSLLRAASEASFATYVLHPPVLVSISLAISAWAAPPEAKFLVVALLGVPAAFLVGWLATRPPRLGRFLGAARQPSP